MIPNKKKILFLKNKNKIYLQQNVLMLFNPRMITTLSQ